jgi:hypothetical protein
MVEVSFSLIWMKRNKIFPWGKKITIKYTKAGRKRNLDYPDIYKRN